MANYQKQYVDNERTRCEKCGGTCLESPCLGCRNGNPPQGTYSYFVGNGNNDTVIKKCTYCEKECRRHLRI